MKKGSIHTIRIEKFADKGKSLARLNGYVIFVPGAVPGDLVEVRVKRPRKKHAEATLLKLLEPSPLRTAPRCSYTNACGGCKWQHVTYESQLEAKRVSVADTFERMGQFDEVTVPPVIPADPYFYYRNKMEFTFSANRWLTNEEIKSGEQFDTDFALGMHAPGQFSKVLDLHECYLQSELSVEIVNKIRSLCRQKEWEPWDIRKHTGYLRHLVIRTSAHTDDVMVNLVTNGYDKEKVDAVQHFLQTELPAVTTFVNTINTGVAQTAFGEKIYTVFGSGLLTDKIGNLSFEIAPNAFFQTNTRQAEVLYRIARSFADLKSTDVVYDLYCGAGTISLFVADSVSKVVGIELVEEAVQNARRNATLNGVTNCSFFAGDMIKILNAEFVKEQGNPNVVITDPPRAGMHKKTVDQIIALRPERVIYVSCNPQTQVRDLDLLRPHFAIEAVQPVDMFPHTHHIENVVKLRAR